MDRAEVAAALRGALLDPAEAVGLTRARRARRPRCWCRCSSTPPARCTPSSPSGAPTCAGTPGEISFPGGRRDDGDADLWSTALREAHEEIGLPPGAVELLGALQPTPTFVTDYAIYPFVGLIEPGFAWVLQEREVAQVLELPLEDVRAGYGRRRLVRRGMPFRTDTYETGGHLIWGATARIVADLLERVRAAGARASGSSSTQTVTGCGAGDAPAASRGGRAGAGRSRRRSAGRARRARSPGRGR